MTRRTLSEDEISRTFAQLGLETDDARKSILAALGQAAGQEPSLEIVLMDRTVERDDSESADAQLV